MTSKRFWRTVRYFFVYNGIRFLIFVSAILPRVLWLRICGTMGKAGYWLAPRSKQLILEHLTLAYGTEKSRAEIIALSKKVFCYLGMNAGDFLRASHVSSMEELLKFLVIHGYENFEAAIAKGRGVIFLTCHLGAFDLQVTTMALKGLNPNIIGTPLKDPRLNQLLWKYRNQHGAVAVERGKETFRLIKILKSGGSVALLIDQDTRVKSRFVNFFGRPAATPVGAAVLALKTRAIVIPTYIYLGADWKQHMVILPELPVVSTGNEEEDMVRTTQEFSDFIEAAVRKHPEQWVWMHRRWRTKPGQEIT